MAHVKDREHRERYTVRLLASELETIQNNARIAGLTVSEYIRKCTLNKRVRSRVNVQVIGQVSRMCGLQKHLLAQIKSHPHEDALRGALNQTLAELTATLRALIRAEPE